MDKRDIKRSHFPCITDKEQLMVHRLGFWRKCQTRQGIRDYKKDYLLVWFPNLQGLAQGLLPPVII